MKEEYCELEMEVIEFEQDDVIDASTPVEEPQMK